MPNVSAFWALFLPRARRIPWITHWHSDVLASEYSLGLRLFYILYRPFERAVLKRSQAIIATSPPYLESSPALNNFLEKCHVVPLGLDPSKLLSAPRQEHGRNDKAPLRVLAVGRLTYYKGFEYLIRAAAEVQHLEVHLVGTGDQEQRLRALARKLGLELRVFFHGQLNNRQLAEQFTACDCLCLPSVERTEAFGMVLLEAMACGKATIVSDVPGSGMGWVVDDGITGLKVPTGDEKKLALALQHLDRDRDKMRWMGTQGQHKFHQFFHIDQSANKVVALYRYLLGESPAYLHQEST
jgi:rhamnosyl/mannosyltransferase